MSIERYTPPLFVDPIHNVGFQDLSRYTVLSDQMSLSSSICLHYFFFFFLIYEEALPWTESIFFCEKKLYCIFYFIRKSLPQTEQSVNTPLRMYTR